MMRKMMPALLLVLLAPLLIVSCRPEGARKLARTIHRAEKVVLYEGLPHQAFERDLLERERRTKPVVELGGYPFYRESLALTASDAQRLSRILADPQTLHPFAGEKLCGGFHPDYAVEWHHGGERSYVLLCFGCREAKVLGRGMEARFDLDRNADASLETLLKPYHKNRPANGRGIAAPAASE